MKVRTSSFFSASADQTANLARALSGHLAGGDVIALEGSVGAGKTHFARALIKSLLSTDEDVPSPTFTLVQTYPTGDCDIWHADLYRLTSIQEIEELGLVEAFETDICLVEWPDRLGALLPAQALRLSLEYGPEDDTRNIHASWSESKWDPALRALKNK